MRQAGKKDKCTGIKLYNKDGRIVDHTDCPNKPYGKTKWIKFESKDGEVKLCPACHVKQFVVRNCRHQKGKWAGEPFALIPWQNNLIERAYGAIKDNGERQYRIVYCEIPKKNGKALDLLEALPTPDGWKQLKDIHRGDYLFDERGNKCRVIAESEIWYDRPCYEVTFASGQKIIADKNHEWLTIVQKTYSYDGQRIGKSQLEKLRITEELFYTQKGYGGRGNNHKITSNAQLQLPEIKLPIQPYTLGAWLGDGNNYNASITCAYSDFAILDNIRSDGYNVKEWENAGKNSGQFSIGGNGRTQKARNNSLQSKLRQFNLLKNKHIPLMYLRSSVHQRFELLKGLMDTDGSCDKRGQCEFTSTNRRLAENVVELCRTLGIKVKLHTSRAMLNGKDCGEKYRVFFHTDKDHSCFKLTRKEVRLKNVLNDRSRYQKIINVKKVSSVPVKCIQVNSSSGLFLVGKDMIPTHNSELASALALYGLVADGEIGAEVYSAAGEKEQASLVYYPASQMVRGDEDLAARLKVLDSRKRIIDYKTNSFYQVLSAETYSKHGLNPSTIIFDEIHAQPNRDLWDVLVEGTDIARSQQIILVITTAGIAEDTSIGYEQRKHAQACLLDPDFDKEFLPIIYAGDVNKDLTKKYDWEDPAVWKRCNPSLGYIFELDNLEKHASDVKKNPSRLNNFLRFRLNIWTSQISRYIPMDKWDECLVEFDSEKLLGKKCFGGIDLSSSQDLTAFVLVFPPDEDCDKYIVVPRFYVPEERMVLRSKRDRVPYDVWCQQGYMNKTPGNRVDYSFIRKDVVQASKDYKLKECAFDPWRASESAAILVEEHGIEMIEHRQGMKSMSEPTKHLFEHVVAHELAHDGHPILRWNMDNLSVKTDAEENVKPEKDKSADRIDGTVALIMALGRAITDVSKPSVYKDRGVLMV